MAHVILAMIQIFLGMGCRAFRDELDAGAGAGHTVKDIAKIRGTCLFARRCNPWSAAGLGIFHDDGIEGWCRQFIVKRRTVNHSNRYTSHKGRAL